MLPQPLPSTGKEEGIHHVQLPGVFIINLKSELVFNVSENKIKPHFPSHLDFRHEDILHSALPQMALPGLSLTRKTATREPAPWQAWQRNSLPPSDGSVTSNRWEADSTGRGSPLLRLDGLARSRTTVAESGRSRRTRGLACPGEGSGGHACGAWPNVSALQDEGPNQLRVQQRLLERPVHVEVMDVGGVLGGP